MCNSIIYTFVRYLCVCGWVVGCAWVHQLYIYIYTIFPFLNMYIHHHHQIILIQWSSLGLSLSLSFSFSLFLSLFHTHTHTHTHTYILYILSLSLSIWRKTKEKKRRKTFMFMDCSFIIYLTLWRCISMCSKRFMYFNVPTWSKLFFAVLLRICYFHVSFPASIRLMLSCLKLSY